MRGVFEHRVVKSILRQRGADIFTILLTIIITYKNAGVLELFKKYMVRGRKSGKTKQD